MESKRGDPVPNWGDTAIDKFCPKRREQKNKTLDGSTIHISVSFLLAIPSDRRTLLVGVHQWQDAPNLQTVTVRLDGDDFKKRIYLCAWEELTCPVGSWNSRVSPILPNSLGAR